MAPSLPSCAVLMLVFIAAEVILCKGSQQNTSSHSLICCCCFYVQKKKVTALICFPLPGGNECVAKNFGHGSVVCVCNSTYCDSVGSVTLPPLGQYSSYLSSMAGSRLKAGHGQVQEKSSGAGERRRSTLFDCFLWCWSTCAFLNVFLSGLRLTIVPFQKYQRIRGFGGAMTDAAAINILSLSHGAQEQLLRQYFSNEGILYELNMQPISKDWTSYPSKSMVVLLQHN